MGAHVREALVVCSEKVGAGITVWDVETGEHLLHIPTCAAPPGGLLCLRNELLVASQVQKDRAFFGGAIFFWTLNKPQALSRSYPMEAIGPIASTRDGSYLVGGASSGNAYVWEVSSGRLNTWTAHCKSLNFFCFSSDDSLLISGSEDGTVCVWPMISILDVAASQDSRSLIPYNSWSEHVAPITSLLSISHGSDSIVISGSLDGTCKMLDIISGRLLQTHVFPQAITATTVDPAQQVLFAGGADGRIFACCLDLWLMEDLVIFSDDESGSGVLLGHKASITALSFSINGLWLVSASEDNTACLWDVTGQHVIRRFSHPKGHITNVLMIPRSAVSAMESPRTLHRVPLPQLDKVPQLLNARLGTRTLIPSCCAEEEDTVTNGFRSSMVLNQQILDLEHERTPEAMEMKVEMSVENRLWALNMAKHTAAMGRLLQSRLLEMMQRRLCGDRDVMPSKRKKPSSANSRQLQSL